MSRVQWTSASILVAVLLTPYPVTASGAHGQMVDANGRPSVATPAAIDVNAWVASAVERTVLLQRTRSRPTRGSGGGSGMRWLGLGMVGLGAALALNGALSTCGVSGDFRAESFSVTTSKCWTRAGIGAGVAGAGLFVMTR